MNPTTATDPAIAPDSGVRPKILEAADCSFGGPRGADFALTCEWPDGTETLEHVSEHAARLLGYEPDDEGNPSNTSAPKSQSDDRDYYRPDASGYSRSDEEWFFDMDGKP